MAIHKSINLECTTGGSYKEYRLSIEGSGARWNVNALWGKIGSPLRLTVKGDGLALADAEKMFEKIVRKQLNESPPYVVVGAKEDGQSVADATETQAPAGAVRKVIARVIPQLCAPVQDERELEKFFRDDNIAMEEKFNGKRKEVIKASEHLSVTNKQGQTTGVGMLPKNKNEFLKVPFDFVMDTEDEPVGGGCVLLDVLSLRNRPTDAEKLVNRRQRLEEFYREITTQHGVDPKVIRLAEHVTGETAKRAFFARLKKVKAEGAIFKRLDSIYVPGEAGRDFWWKHKFQATASFIVTGVRIGGKSSISVAVLDGLTRVSCGKCAIPANKEMPELNETVEVRYIYAERGTNSLNQPFYIGSRKDEVSIKECVIGQLKYKQKEATNES